MGDRRQTVVRTAVSNTYCELCNARFSNVENNVARMRNCHPTNPYSLNQSSSSSSSLLQFRLSDEDLKDRNAAS
jgi:hypothetical protein